MAHKNQTFWSQEIVERGWSPLPNLLTKHWNKLGIKIDAFPTLIWMLSWVRNDLSNFHICQAEIAKQQGDRSRNTINVHINWMKDAGVLVQKPRDRFDLSLLERKLLELEKLENGIKCPEQPTPQGVSWAMPEDVQRAIEMDKLQT